MVEETVAETVQSPVVEVVVVLLGVEPEALRVDGEAAGGCACKSETESQCKLSAKRLAEVAVACPAVDTSFVRGCGRGARPREPATAACGCSAGSRDKARSRCSARGRCGVGGGVCGSSAGRER